MPTPGFAPHEAPPHTQRAAPRQQTQPPTAPPLPFPQGGFLQQQYAPQPSTDPTRRRPPKHARRSNTSHANGRPRRHLPQGWKSLHDALERAADAALNHLHLAHLTETLRVTLHVVAAHRPIQSRIQSTDHRPLR